MSAIYTHKDYKNARKLTVIAAGCYGCNPGVINGVKNSPEKILVIYLAQQVFGFTDSDLAALFSINKHYMLDKLKDLSVELLVDQELKEMAMRPLDIYKRLEIIELANG